MTDARVSPWVRETTSEPGTHCRRTATRKQSWSHAPTNREHKQQTYRALCAAYQVVGLETELALKRRHHSTLNAGFAWERRSTKLGVDEELAVEQLGGRVEWRARDRRINVVLGSNSVSDSSVRRIHGGNRGERRAHAMRNQTVSSSSKPPASLKRASTSSIWSARAVS